MSEMQQAINDMFPEAVVPKVDENRRYTTRVFMHFIKRVAGVGAWDLDPDADAESHHAPRWFCSPGDLDGEWSWQQWEGCAGADSLAQSWAPPAEWMGWSDVDLLWCVFDNPPFDDIEPRLVKIWALIAEANRLGFEVRIAMVIPGNRTEQGFWQDHVEPFLAGHERENREGYKLVAHSPRTRQFYGHPGNPEPKSGQAEWPSVVLVWSRA